MIRKEEEDQEKIDPNIFFPFIKRRKGIKINNKGKEKRGDRIFSLGGQIGEEHQGQQARRTKRRP